METLGTEIHIIYNVGKNQHQFLRKEGCMVSQRGGNSSIMGLDSKWEPHLL